MAAGCCDSHCETPAVDPRWRRALWIALVLNAGMFAAEIIAGLTANSLSLQADAIDFLGDAANYAISLGVVGMALYWRSRAALLKGATMLLFGLYLMVSAGYAVTHGRLPHAETMGGIGLLALLVNAGVALMLFRFRSGDANMRSVWICSRNDAIGNVAVMAAAAGVFGTGTAWPDLLVAAGMAALALWGGVQITRQAWNEVKTTPRETRLVAPGSGQ